MVTHNSGRNYCIAFSGMVTQQWGRIMKSMTVQDMGSWMKLQWCRIWVPGFYKPDMGSGIYEGQKVSARFRNGAYTAEAWMVRLKESILLDMTMASLQLHRRDQRVKASSFLTFVFGSSS